MVRGLLKISFLTNLNFLLSFIFSVHKENQPAVTHFQFQNCLVKLSSWGFAEVWGAWGTADECPLILDVQILRKVVMPNFSLLCLGTGLRGSLKTSLQAQRQCFPSGASIEPECVDLCCCRFTKRLYFTVLINPSCKRNKVVFLNMALLTRK